MLQYDTSLSARVSPGVKRPVIGMKVRFTPAAFLSGPAGDCKRTPDGMVPVVVQGEVIEINAAHRWYRCRFEAFEYVMYECFKF